MKEDEPSTLQPSRSKVPKYSDRFKDILTKPEVKQLLVQKNQKQQIYNPVSLLQGQQYVQKLNKQCFFFRVKSIGVGAHSFVHLVQQQESKCLYAQKAILKAHGLQTLDLLRNQIKIQSLLSHDNLISLYHFYSDSSYIYLIMQYAQQSLFNLKSKFKVFKEKEVIEILRQLLHGLEYMHVKGFIHADMKIQNVMVRNGRVKLCDFGYATTIKQNAKINSQDIVGTLQYLSPQYVRGFDSGPMRDVWAVGIICYELWTGKNPFQNLKENQKWSQLNLLFIQSDRNIFIDQIDKIQHLEERKSDKIKQFIKTTLCPLEQRLSASKLLQFQFFNIT